jgi:TolB-like protein/DNA-binding winged helix-turn-helix (wHTH) protein
MHATTREELRSFITLTSAAVAAAAEVRAGERVPQFTVRLPCALTSSTVNGLITQVLSFRCLLAELGAGAAGSPPRWWMGEPGQDFRVRFGVFELDTRSGELRKAGIRIRLQDQPFKVLVALLERPGGVVTREELKRRIWPEDSFGDFDHAVNVAVAKLRTALGDAADIPRFVETLPRRGYRFIAPVDGLAPTATRSLIVRWIGLGAVAALLLLAALVGFNVGGWRDRISMGGTKPISSIAVLPLANLSNNPDQDYFADGMTEELTTNLAKIGALRVISRTSTMRYKGTKKSAPEIARELNVDGIIEGSVERSDNRVRITAQLIHAPSDTHLWADSYERDLGDALALQDEVARAIASEIKVTLTPEEQVRLTSARPVDPEAQDFYLKGRYYWNKRTPETLKKSLEYFQQAVDKDPGYALAYSGLADSYLMLQAGYYQVLSPKEAIPKAEAAAKKALELDATLADAHTSLAWSRFAWDWDWRGAEQEFKRAIELNPSYANAHHWYATYLFGMGRYPEAIAEDRKAESLDPLSIVISVDVAMEALRPARMYDQEMEQCRKTLEMEPNFPSAHACLSDSYAHKRMYNEAIAEMQKAIDLSGGSVFWVSLLGYTYAMAGRPDEARKILNELKARSNREFVSAQDFAYIYTGLGDKDQAYVWFEKAYEERSDVILNLNADPDFESLRSDPRFQELLRRLNFPAIGSSSSSSH